MKFSAKLELTQRVADYAKDEVASLVEATPNQEVARTFLRFESVHLEMATQVSLQKRGVAVML